MDSTGSPEFTLYQQFAAVLVLTTWATVWILSINQIGARAAAGKGAGLGGDAAGRRVLRAMLAGLALAGLLFIPAGSELDARELRLELFEGFGIMAVFGLTALLALPCGGLTETRAPAAKPAREFAIYAAATMAIFAGALLFKIEATSESILAKATPERPLLLGSVAILGLMAAVYEEAMYRGILFDALRKLTRDDGAAIGFSSLLFAFAHAGMATPAGYKELQILLLGLLFGIARVRLGLGAAIALHLINNGLALSLHWLGHHFGYLT
ncbi:MAG: CPBP family intramembrane glutamic endopeptidase [Candidatus Sumerlaeia bacterium]|nr:CPBP family intramembrane glutamic endopeptidase [Candidatus Sumerlaeia bacterium]